MQRSVQQPNDGATLQSLRPCRTASRFGLSNPRFYLRVDINEYAKAQTGQQIITYGVATCMATIISIPEKFTYLGHVYPLDDSYHSDWDKMILDFQLWLGNKEHIEKKRNLIENMMTRIERYDVYP